MLSYITLGGLSAAIYNEVLQFFVIVAALLPLTLIGLHRVGGWGGLTDKITAAAGKNPDTIAPAAQQLNSWPGNALTGFSSDFWSIVGIVFGLGFVLSFGYWTTNFVEVQRAMASNSISSARKTPIIGAYPKMFVPFITIVPGMIAAVMVHEIAQVKAGETVGRRLVGRRSHLQRLPALPDARHPAQRSARCRDHRPARGVHGRYGGERLGVQHRAGAMTSGSATS